MTYKDGIEYATDYEFSLEQLADIKPEHIYKWMAVKTYGTVNQTQAKTIIQHMVDQPQWNSYYKKGGIVLLHATSALDLEWCHDQLWKPNQIYACSWPS